MSQGEKIVYVKAGASGQQVPAGGDFIFIKEAARPVRVIVDGQPITMGRGDKRRLQRKDPSKAAFESFEVENASDVDLRVVMVVGEGDYESQIVTGELNVSETIKTASLGSDSMPVMYTREIGVADADGGSVGVGDVIASYDAADVVGGSNGYGGVFAHAGSVWAVSITHLRQFSEDGSLLSELELPVPFPAEEVRGAAVDGQGIVYVLIGGINGNSEYAGFWGVYTLNLSTGSISEFFDTVGKPVPEDGETHKFSGRGLQVRGGELYWIHRSSSYDADFWVVDIDTLSVGSRRLVSAFQSGYTFGILSRYDAGSDMFYLADKVVSGSTFEIVDDYSGMANIIPATEEVYLPGAGVVFGLSWGSEWTFWSTVEVSYVATLWIQKVGQPTTRREYRTYSQVSFVPRAGGVVMVGEIVRAFLEGLKVDGVVRSNYLDYVTVLKYEDGHYELEKSAGTASWAFRGYRDYGELMMDSEVTVGLLPEYLTSAL